MKNMPHRHKSLYIFGGAAALALLIMAVFSRVVPTNLQGYFVSTHNPSTLSAITLSAQITQLTSEYAELDMHMVANGATWDDSKNVGFMFNPKWGCHFNGAQNQSNSYTSYRWYEHLNHGLGDSSAVLKFSGDSIIVNWGDNAHTVEGPSLIQTYIHPDTMNPITNGQLEVCAALIDHDITGPARVNAWQSFMIPVGQLKVVPPTISTNPLQVTNVIMNWSSSSSAIASGIYSYKMNDSSWSVPVNLQSQSFGYNKVNTPMKNGDNIFYIKQKDIFGQWSNEASKTFKAYASYTVMPIQSNPGNVGMPTGKTSGQ